MGSTVAAQRRRAGAQDQGDSLCRTVRFDQAAVSESHPVAVGPDRHSPRQVMADGRRAPAAEGEPVHALPWRQGPKPRLLEGGLDEFVQFSTVRAGGGLAQLAPAHWHSLTALMRLSKLPGPQEGPLRDQFAHPRPPQPGAHSAGNLFQHLGLTAGHVNPARPAVDGEAPHPAGHHDIRRTALSFRPHGHIPPARRGCQLDRQLMAGTIGHHLQGFLQRTRPDNLGIERHVLVHGTNRRCAGKLLGHAVEFARATTSAPSLPTGRIATAVTTDLGTSPRSCYELEGPASDTVALPHVRTPTPQISVHSVGRRSWMLNSFRTWASGSGGCCIQQVP